MGRYNRKVKEYKEPMRRKLTGILAVILSVSMLATPVLAATADGDPVSAESESEQTMETPEEETVETIVNSDAEQELLQAEDEEENDISEEEIAGDEQTDSATLQTEEQTAPVLEVSSSYTIAYDDVLNFQSDYPNYTILKIEQNTEPDSYQVSGGECTTVKDTCVLAKKTDTKVHAEGIGTAVVTLTSSAGVKKQVQVTVEAAPLTLMLITGQSNAEGWCSTSSGYQYSYSVACPDGQVYSTYCPNYLVASGVIGSDVIAGLDFQDYCTKGNVDDFVPGSLTKNVSISGQTTQYHLNQLTESGNGKTGIDSGLAYEWNRLTGDKVWVVNAAEGASAIGRWVPGEDCYVRAVAIFDDVYQTYEAELESGHYVAGKQLMFWLQGETDSIANATVTAYQSKFDLMYQGFMDTYAASGEETDLDAIGAIAVRATKDKVYTGSSELYMTASRAVQYAAAASAAYPDFYIVSNANEQWLSNKDVYNYFQAKYGSVIGDTDDEYTMQCGTGVSTPTAEFQIHSDIHYSQIGHNENGITAADGMYHALQGDSRIQSVDWRDVSGKAINSDNYYLQYDKEATLIPVTEPVYAAKQADYYIDYPSTVSARSYLSSCDNIWYRGDRSNSVFQYYMDRSSLYAGELKTLTNASFIDTKTVTLSVKEGSRTVSGLQLHVIETYDNITAIVGEYTGFYEINGSWYYYVNGLRQNNLTGVVQDTEGAIDDTMSWWYVEKGEMTVATTIAKWDGAWWYIKDGKPDASYTGVAKRADNSTWWGVIDGKVDFTYTGFLPNDYGWWYVSAGKVSLNQTGVYKGTVEDVTAWWYVQNNKVTYTNTVAKNSYGWWAIRNGQVNFSYTGFANNTNGWWYCVNGKVNFNTNSVMKGTVDGVTAWWYVSSGKVTLTNTVAKNSSGWWYIKNGKVDFTFTGLGKNSNGWWYCKNGKVDFTYTGLVENSSGLWYCVKGKLDTTYTGIAKYNNVWRYVKDGKADLTYNGYVLVNGKYYRVKNGEVQS